MSTERWLEFWAAQGRTSIDADEQSQVLRTYNKQPITAERWRLTLTDLDRKFPVGLQDDLLDLGCGNGLLTEHFAPRCRSVTSVDVSADLLACLARRSLPNVNTIHCDMRLAGFPDASFSRILMYATIQYLSETEVVALFRNLSRWLRPVGLLFVGDVPDRDRLWNFYNTSERRTAYFENLVADRDVVGSWFQSEWLRNLAAHVGFEHSEMVPQPTELIYSHFRFDLRARR
jgi:SAM-dependent methyltransferase